MLSSSHRQQKHPKCTPEAARKLEVRSLTKEIKSHYSHSHRKLALKSWHADCKSTYGCALVGLLYHGCDARFKAARQVSPHGEGDQSVLCFKSLLKLRQACQSSLCCPHAATQQPSNRETLSGRSRYRRVQYTCHCSRDHWQPMLRDAHRDRLGLSCSGVARALDSKG